MLKSTHHFGEERKKTEGRDTLRRQNGLRYGVSASRLDSPADHTCALIANIIINAFSAAADATHNALVVACSTDMRGVASHIS